ncbi:IS4 family transposase [Paenibacillus elgii]|uniref:IS4 family transposase n=1 Tax=Paenibacillus elgii TaxID=189691 RepID=UPI0030DA4B42
MPLSISEEMHLLAQELQRHFSPSQLELLARQTGFVQRKSKCTSQDFAFLCIFLNDHIATTPLTRLCSQLDATNHLSMSAEGLNQRFNPSAVAFLQSLFSTLLQEKILASFSLPCECTAYFHRIRILDSTVFQLPDPYADRYHGSGGSSHTAGMKIQLEYELKTGEFLQVDVGPGKNNDGLYGTKRAKTVEKGDLCIRDLGYFCLNDFEEMERRGAFYVSRLKLNVRVYEKNEEIEQFKDGKVKKQSLYKELDLEEIMNRLQPGEIVELPEVYLGRYNKFRTQLLIYKLTAEQTQKRLMMRAKQEKKKNITYKERIKRLSAINIYMTNTPDVYLKKEHIHDLYSLRWQIEILFKTWKSIFHIDQCKLIKIERFECHVYGQLIAILLSSSLMFQMRRLLLMKKKKEASEFKVICIVKEYFLSLHNAIKKQVQDVGRVLLQLFRMIEKNGCKSHRYEKKTVFDILGVVYEYTQKSQPAA